MSKSQLIKAAYALLAFDLAICVAAGVATAHGVLPVWACVTVCVWLGSMISPVMYAIRKGKQ